MSAGLRLESGDADGACNRADYTLFDAARAALLASDAPVEAGVARKHGGLISAFSLHLVKSGRVPVELGRTLDRAEKIRIVTDYKGDRVDAEEAAWAVQQAEVFVNAMRAKFMTAPGVSRDGDVNLRRSMAEKFIELRAKMSAAARERAAARTDWTCTDCG